MVAERAYAKVNLTLDVMKKRRDGYHEVDMVMQTIDLSDLVWLDEIAGDQIEIEATASHIPLDGRNLAVVAARLFRDFAGIQKGIKIRIEKNIPVAAGLAGGSSDAAAVLRGLNRLWNTGFSLQQLADLGASIGSDVPFCVYGGSAIARGRGEIITPIDHKWRAWVILVRPPVFVSTADIYQALTKEDYTNTPSGPRLVEAMRGGNFEEVSQLVSNGLMKTTLRLYPEVSVMKKRIENIARSEVYMSGSGPTLFALFPTQSAAQRLYHAVRGFTKEVHLCRIL